MTGMKEGAGEDPFASSDPETNPSDPDDNDPEPTADTETDKSMTETPPSQPTEIPMIFRRDSVQDNRDRVPLFLQQDTQSAERDALRELEKQFDDDISLTDLREALVLAGLANLSDVESQLRDWGYGLTFD